MLRYIVLFLLILLLPVTGSADNIRRGVYKGKVFRQPGSTTAFRDVYKLRAKIKRNGLDQITYIDRSKGNVFTKNTVLDLTRVNETVFSTGQVINVTQPSLNTTCVEDYTYTITKLTKKKIYIDFYDDCECSDGERFTGVYNGVLRRKRRK